MLLLLVADCSLNCCIFAAASQPDLRTARRMESASITSSGGGCCCSCRQRRSPSSRWMAILDAHTDIQAAQQCCLNEQSSSSASATGQTAAARACDIAMGGRRGAASSWTPAIASRHYCRGCTRRGWKARSHYRIKVSRDCAASISSLTSPALPLATQLRSSLPFLLAPLRHLLATLTRILIKSSRRA